MKVCSKCKIEKELSEFDRQRDKHSGICKECRKEYVNNHYRNNKKYYKDKAKKNNAIYRERYNEYKRSLSCTDCGFSFKNYPAVCDFHHLDDEMKDYNPASKAISSWGSLIKEIKKCIPLCANCHRIRHSKEISSSE